MKKFYSHCRGALLLFVSLLFVFTSHAQTTINTTVGSTGYTDNNGVTGNSCITFVIENTSGQDILLNQVSNFFLPASNGTNVALWYSTTSLAGAATVTTPTWTQIATGGPISVPASGIYDLFSGLSFTIPNGAQYRFAIQSSINMRYAGTSTTGGQADPDVFTANGVSLKVGEAQIGTSFIGYAGAFPTPPNSPRCLIGSITFSPASPCTAPPTPGDATANNTTVCSGNPVVLNLTGNSAGTGQTYQWQTSSTAGGTYTDIGSALNAPGTTINPTTSAWYKAKVTCSGQSAFSQPIQVNVNPLFPAGTYTINSGLPTGGTNFQTFADAVNAIKCGIAGAVVFNVAAGSGPYSEQVTIPQIGGTSSTNTVTFSGNGATISYTTSDANNRTGIILNGADYITLDSLVVDVSGGTYGWGIGLTGQADNNVVKRCTILTSTTATTTNYTGIALNGSLTTTAVSGNNGNGNTFLNNTINGGYYGVYLYGNSGSTVQNTNNRVEGNVIKDEYLYGIYSIYQSTGLVVSKNDISRPTRSNGTTTTTAYGIYTTTGTTAALIEKNRLHNMFDAMPANAGAFYCLYVAVDGTAASPNTVANNLVYNIGGNGAVYGLYNTSSDYMKAYHNTIAFDDQSASTGAAYGFYQTTVATGVEFKNNIVYITRSGTGIKRALYFVTTTSTIASNNNVLYLNSAAGTDNNLAQFGTANYAALSNWQTANANAYDQQSISVDPMFAAAGSDYKPTDASINNLGANVGITTDITGAARNVSAPDPGAFEFTLNGCTNPPTPGGAVTSSPDVCPNTPFTLSLAGNSIGDGQTYQWQSSPNNTTWTNVGTPSVGTLYTASQAVTTYYRAAVRCNNGTIVYSTSVLVSSPSLVSGTYTINASLPTGSGNFQTFADALNSIKCGINGPVVFNVANNVYNEQVTIPAIAGASATNTITINGNGSTISYNTTDANNRTGIILNGADYIVLDSLTIDVSQGTYGWGIGLTAQADSNIIRRCTIITNSSATTTNYVGIAINGSLTTTAVSANSGNGNQFIGNTINGGYYGFYLYGNSAVTTQNNNNRVEGNTIKDAYLYAVYAIYQSNGLVVGKNDISKPNRSNGTTTTTTYGIFITTATTGALIEKNRIHNMFDAMAANTGAFYCIYISTDGTAALPNIVSNNLVYNIGGNGAIYGIYNTGSDYMKAYHNTIAHDDQTASTGAAYGIYQTTAATGLEYKNNIVSIVRSGTGIKRAIYFVTTTSTIASNNNVLYLNATGGSDNNLGQFGTTSYLDLAAWQGANTNAYDQQSVSVDPVFDPSYIPTTSLVNNTGTPVGVTTDIVGTSRSLTNPDAGAYEFSTLTTGLNFAAEALLTPAVNSKGCYTASEQVTIRIRNNRTTTHNFTTNPVTVTVNVTGASTQTVSTTINVGSLPSDSTLNVVMTQSLNMSVAGTYTIDARTVLAGDVNASNDAMQPVTRTKVALTAGIAAASPGTYCLPSPINPTLSSNGYAGYTGLQWLQSTSANTGYTAINSATSTPYSVTGAISQPMYYKLVATCGTTRDTSAAALLTYSNPQVTSTTPATRCGAGSVTLGATASAGSTLTWYAGPTGGAPLATGASYTTTIAANTAFYVAASEGGASSGASPILVSEMDLGTITDQLEIQNVSGNPVDVTGWRVAISNSYTDINLVNANIQVLSGVMNPGETKSWTDLASATNYWGSNILWNAGAFPTYAGWAAILDNNNNLMDIVFLNWPAANIQAANIVIGTTAITASSKWTGNAVDASVAPDGQSISRMGNLDNDNPGDFTVIPFTIGTTNPGMTLPFAGFGCSTARTGVLAKIDCATPVTLLNFKGERQGSLNKLDWTTATEANNSGFELQRSADGINFTKLTFVSSKATNGNSTNTLNYFFDDVKPLAGNGYYRLTQLDKDGKSTLSKIVLIKGAKVNAVTITSIYPNPVKQTLNMIVGSPADEKISLVITDVTGKVVKEQTTQLIAGDNQLKLDVVNLAQGTYMIKAVCSTGCESAVQKFVKH
jgi:hypothetical protein